MGRINMNNVFLYFAYGSNLLAERIHMNNPSAIRRGIGKLNDYRLDFGHRSDKWNGSVATIVPDPGNDVWGSIWELNVSDIPNLDRQEGVPDKIYEVLEVNVETPEQNKMTCRCYQLCQLPAKIMNDEVPEDRKPSQLYLSIILKGAIESKLPSHYVEQLEKIQHNGWNDASKIQKIMLGDALKY